MKEHATCTTNEEVIFDEMLRSVRNQIECAFGRLKARWRILNRPMDISSYIPLEYRLVHARRVELARRVDTAWIWCYKSARVPRNA